MSLPNACEICFFIVLSELFDGANIQNVVELCNVLTLFGEKFLFIHLRVVHHYAPLFENYLITVLRLT